MLLRVRPRAHFDHVPLQKCSRLSAAQQRWQSTGPHSHKIAILGGGVTGLSAAYYLSKALPRASITLYEASDRIGGWLSAKRVPVKGGSVLFEAGPRTLRPSYNGLLAGSLVNELDLANDAIFAQVRTPAARNRFIYYPDRLTRLPHPAFGLSENIWTCLTEPALKGCLWAGATEILRPQRAADISDESVGSFFSRRLGKGFVDRLISAVMHGIYAGDVWQLSAKSLFANLWHHEEKAGSILAGFVEQRGRKEIPKSDVDFMKALPKIKDGMDRLLEGTLAQTAVFTFKDGLGMLTERLARKCLETGNLQFQIGSAVEQLALTGPNNSQIQVTTKDSTEPQQYTHVISALSARHLNQIVKSPDTASPLIPDIPAVNVMTVNLYYRTPDLTPEGFGYLIPQATPFDQNPERALGVIFDNAYSPSSEDVDKKNWQITDMDMLRQLREDGNLIDVNGFSWYNMPSRPNVQDHVEQRGTKLTVMLGGHYWNDWPVFPDQQQALSLAKSVVERHLGIKEEPEVWMATLQKDCIPQYTVGHSQRLKAAHNNLWAQYRGRLRVAGNWMRGVGVNDSLRSSWEVVEGLRQGRDGTGLEHVGMEEYVEVDPKANDGSS